MALSPDFLIIGAGVAGLRAAIELAQSGRVLVVAKESLRESASEYAQGGIAAALSDDDQVELHEQDTLAAGDGLCDRDAVRVLVEEGAHEVERLIDWGTEFDRDHGKLAFTREGAHSRNRILHAHGDSTGREIARSLYHRAASLGSIEFRSFRAITDLLLDSNGEVTGALLGDEPVYARAVLLASGGLGRVYKESTNPDVATGDGVAMAWRAGAAIRDIEFVQFHPTALHVEGAPRFLLSEALRGEGGRLLNTGGERFTDELLPRDQVSRAIVAEMRRTNSPHVFLDISHRGADWVRERFPRIWSTCLEYGVDIAKGPAPVHPAAHYAMGGVDTDLNGRSTLPRLYAAGETACTGVHGANRLASNSLLEGLVFGARAGRAMREESSPTPTTATAPAGGVPAITVWTIRELAWSGCGISRDAAGISRVVSTLDAARRTKPVASTPVEQEARNVHDVVSLIARAALAREESRGAHFRTDFPTRRDGFLRHSIAVGVRPITYKPLTDLG